MVSRLGEPVRIRVPLRLRDSKDKKADANSGTATIKREKQLWLEQQDSGSSSRHAYSRHYSRKDHKEEACSRKLRLLVLSSHLDVTKLQSDEDHEEEEDGPGSDEEPREVKCDTAAPPDQCFVCPVRVLYLKDKYVRFSLLVRVE
jgi:hypothetical protein